MARIYFLKILHRIAPQVSWTLLTPEGLRLHRASANAIEAFARGPVHRTADAMEAIQGDTEADDELRRKV